MQQKKMKLRDARGELLLTQEELARIADHGISTKLISNCETGQPIRRLSAYRILDALNKVRTQRGLTKLEFDDIEWRIRGE